MRSLLHPPLVPIAFALLLASGRADAGMTYIALGDSNVFGNDESTPSSTTPNLGDQGYVRHYAEFLGALNGGIRPQLVNLGISGELASSFITGVPPADWQFRAWQWNLHYPDAATSQNGLMLSALDSAHAAGNSVYVTLNIGTNDFAYLVTTAAWQMASPEQQRALFGQLLGQVAQEYGLILGEIATHAPGARVLLPGFFDNTLPGDPAYGINELAALAGNQALGQIAASSGASYVDFYSVIHGHVLELTNQTGDHHLNQAGYAAVALALEAATVPEPSGVLMLATGVVGLIALARSGAGARRACVEPRPPGR